MRPKNLDDMRVSIEQGRVRCNPVQIAQHIKRQARAEPAGAGIRAKGLRRPGLQEPRVLERPGLAPRAGRWRMGTG